MCVLICSGNRIFFLFRPIFMGQDLDGASSFHPYHILLIWTTSCTTSLFVYLKLFKELAFKSFVENGCKGKSYFRNHQIFQKVFFRKIFQRRSEARPPPGLPFLAPLQHAR